MGSRPQSHQTELN